METEALLREMEQYAQAHHVPILNEGGRRVFAEIVRERRPHRILEVGTAIGYSALLALSRTDEGAVLMSLELSAERLAVARSFLGRSAYAAQVTLLEGDAGALLAGLAAQATDPFDLVFLDAAKGQYPDYLAKSMPLLAREGVIVADNVLFRGYVRSEVRPPRRYRTIVKRLRQYLATVQAPPFATTVFERGDGLALTRRIYEET